MEVHNRAGFADYILFDSLDFPLAVIEAKRPSTHPLSAKTQSKAYAVDQGVRFIIMTNGDQHFLWDILDGDPVEMKNWPSPIELEAWGLKEKSKSEKSADPAEGRRLLAVESVEPDYIVQTQMPRYLESASWKHQNSRGGFIEENKLRFLRKYQIEALKAVQTKAGQGGTRFLLEMATGTGKTLTSAALIKLFLRTGAAHRVLFLVDRLELEDQAHKAFQLTLKKDYISVVYKQNRSDWRKARIVVTTVQSLLAGERYKQEFSPADFGLVISDEAHRSISGEARQVFEYFRGYKLGLTATPRDLLRGIWAQEKEILEFELEKRVFHDTYSIFGCESGIPTFRYGLLDGVKDGFLVNPTVLDCRTEKTTQLLSEEGLTFTVKDEEGEEQEAIFGKRDFERTYFSEETNRVFVQTFLDHGLMDPLSGEMGKSLVFCVSQNHAAKITQLLNKEATKRWPGRYHSDFAMQVTSLVKGAQSMTVQFSENTLGGKTTWLKDYDSSKVRVCVTVGMMTTGYDCQDALNVVLMRPVFSPSEFIQMKGRGTRLHSFSHSHPYNGVLRKEKKGTFYFIDFFANYEFFEKDYDYEEVRAVPLTRTEKGEGLGGEEPASKKPGTVDDERPDESKETRWITIGETGMRIDREFWQDFSSRVQGDEDIQVAAAQDDWETVLKYIKNKLLGMGPLAEMAADTGSSAPADSLSSLRDLVRQAEGRGLGALFTQLFGRSIKFPTKQELLKKAYDRFAAVHPVQPENQEDLWFFFQSYVGEKRIREIIDSGQLGNLNNTALTLDRLRRLPGWRDVVAQIRSEVELDQFGA